MSEFENINQEHLVKLANASLCLITNYTTKK
jgi:hypothetical protein